MTTRIKIALMAVGALAVLAVYFFLGYQPTRGEIASIREEIATVESETSELQARQQELEELEDNRETIEEQIAAGELLIPTGIPSQTELIRYLAAAAERSGVSVSTYGLGGVTRPAEAADADVPDELVAQAFNISASGTKAQIQEFLEQLESPADVPRAIRIDTAAVSSESADSTADGAVLDAQITGAAYAYISVVEKEEPADTSSSSGSGGGEGAEGEEGAEAGAEGEEATEQP